MRRTLVIALLLSGCSPPAEQQSQYNYLVSTIQGLDHQTAESAKVLQYLCAAHEKRAVEYRKIRAWRIDAKVDRYIAGCAKLMAEVRRQGLPDHPDER